MIVGIDEVGRGPWAGPLVVGAVVLGNAHIDGLTDSKKLTKLRREELSRQIIDAAASYGIGWVDAAELDDIGLSAALTLATRRALDQISVPYHEIILDGTVNFLAGTGKGDYVTTMKKADLLIGAVSAASILAKVARDDHMEQMAEQYPAYGFDSHVGYGTAKHRAAIDEHGITPLHRKSFAPIAAMIGRVPGEVTSAAPTNKRTGDEAENAVAGRLERDGYRVIGRNWRTKFCEIDIVAEKDRTLYFIEVKHRKTTAQGGGLEAVTPRKQRQMRFAASLYLTNYPDHDARLAAVATSGTAPDMTIGELLLLE